jgi:hypothetical protein
MEPHDFYKLLYQGVIGSNHINAGDPANGAAASAQLKCLAFPVLLDPNTSLLARLSIHSFLTSLLVGADGKIIDQFSSTQRYLPIAGRAPILSARNNCAALRNLVCQL